MLLSLLTAAIFLAVGTFTCARRPDALGRTGSGDLQFRSPAGICHRQGEFIVADSGNNRLQRIADNGQGFALSADAETSKRGFGLTGLAERARMLGGQFQIQSAPGRGTVITIYIALPGKQA